MAAATGVLIGFGVIAPAANAQTPAAVTVTVSARDGQGWGVQQARKEFRADLREARMEFRADLREARREFRQDIREARQESRAKYREARRELREALRVAREAFLASVEQANDAFRASIAASRETLLLVLKDPASTAEQRKAAVTAYRAEMQQARDVRRTAIEDAIADFKAARKAAWEAFRAAIGK
jgi:hypothetical protein